VRLIFTICLCFVWVTPVDVPVVASEAMSATRELLLPSPPNVKEGLPFVGPAMAFQKDPIGFLRRCQRKHGDVFTVNLLLFKATFALGPEEQRRWFTARPEVLDFFTATVEASQALIGDLSRFRRFSMHLDAVNAVIRLGLMKTERVNVYLDAIRRVARKRFEAWVDAPRIDLFQETSAMINQINVEALLGADTWAKHGETIANAYYELEFNGIKPEAVAFPNFPSPAVRRCKRARDRVDAIMRDLVAERSAAPNDDYISLWLTQTPLDGEGPDVAELAAHLLGLFFAAHTNTTGTFAWTLANLAARPDLFERASAECDAHAERHGESPPYPALRELEFLDACMRESVRLSFAVFLIRRALVPYGAGDFWVPEGQRVCVAPILTHLDPAVYEDPERFDPDRFADLSEARQLEREGTYVQFGLGAHRCLGEMFANAVLRAAWCIFFRDYEIELEDNKLPPHDFTKTLGTAYPTRPVWARVRHRDSEDV